MTYQLNINANQLRKTDSYGGPDRFRVHGVVIRVNGWLNHDYILDFIPSAPGLRAIATPTVIAAKKGPQPEAHTLNEGDRVSVGALAFVVDTPNRSKDLRFRTVRPNIKNVGDLIEWDRIIPTKEEYGTYVLTVDHVTPMGSRVNIYTKELRWPIRVGEDEEVMVY